MLAKATTAAECATIGAEICFGVRGESYTAAFTGRFHLREPHGRGLFNHAANNVAADCIPIRRGLVPDVTRSVPAFRLAKH